MEPVDLCNLQKWRTNGETNGETKGETIWNQQTSGNLDVIYASNVGL